MHKIKLFLTAAIVVMLGANANATCTLNYSCGDGATGSIASSTTTSSATVPDSTGCVKDGYIFSHWSASEQTTATPIAFGNPNPTPTVTTVNYNSLMPGDTYNPGTCNTSLKTVVTNFVAHWMFAADMIVPASQKYVDAEMAKLQPNFAGLGNDKLVLYSNTTNGAVGSRDIVTTLGDSTTATTVPTRGAILTGVNTKQDLFHGRSGYAMVGTGVENVFEDKPIYSAQNNYSRALVEAGTLNQAVVDAVNSELIAVPGVGWRINTADNLTLLDTSNAYLDPEVSPTAICGRADINTSFTSSGSECWCSDGQSHEDVCNTLQYSEWVIIYPTYQLKGISLFAPGNLEGEYVANASDQVRLDQLYASSLTSGYEGLATPGQGWCYYKITSPVVSSWVAQQANNANKRLGNFERGICVDADRIAHLSWTHVRAAMFRTVDEHTNE